MNSLQNNDKHQKRNRCLANKVLKIMCLVIAFTNTITSEAQLWKKLKEKAAQAAERTIERKVEEKTEKETDKAFDSVFNNDKKIIKKKKQTKKNESDDSEAVETAETSEPTYNIERSSDFTPGTIILFEDQFTKDNQGDFPVAWDTNGSGEIALINNEKWLRLGGQSTYIPMLKASLPENYTVEFDLFTSGLDKKTSSQAFLSIILEDNNGFTRAMDKCFVEISPCQFIGNSGAVEKIENGKRQLRNQVGKDYRNAINGKSHMSIAVNKTRMRVWLNDNKLVDIPRLVPEKANYFKLAVRGLRDEAGKDDLFIANFKMTKIGEDNRSKLITEGRLTTNAILFESASANIKKTSYAIIRDIAKVLEENPEVRIKIIGHTDSDGEESSNDTLSKKRAVAVRELMQDAYGIDDNRIETYGMGERQPMAPNNTSQGKAQNRRVEFIKL